MQNLSEHAGPTSRARGDGDAAFVHTTITNDRRTVASVALDPGRLHMLLDGTRSAVTAEGVARPTDSEEILQPERIEADGASDVR